MESDEYESPSDLNEAAKEVHTSHVCQVCGDKEAFMYLGSLCCASCKMFFRRNADFDLVRRLYFSLFQQLCFLLFRILINVHSVEVVISM